MLSTVKIFEILPKHNRCEFISEYFAFNSYSFTQLGYKKLLFPF